MDPPPPQTPAHLASWSAPALQELRCWVKWAGGAGRREVVQIVHSFEEIRTRTPADPNEAALEAIMPQAAWEALPRDAVQGLRPPYTSRTLRQWLQATHPQAWATGAPPPHPTTTTPERERAWARGGQGAQGENPARGPGSAHGDRQASLGTGHRERHNVGAGNHPRAREGREQGPGGRETEDITAGTRTHTQEGHATTKETSAPPPSAVAARPPGAHAPDTRRQCASRTPYGSHQRTPNSHRKPHRE